jgi:hypothetical protein
VNTELIAAEDLTLVSDSYFQENDTKSQMIATIKDIIKSAEQLNIHKTHYAYKLFEMELLIPQYGSNISTLIRDETRKNTYLKIQELLQGIDYYQGPLNGGQAQTHQALVRFQRDYNQREGSEIFNPDNLGIFGYRTLEAIRSFYRMEGS